MSFFTVTDLRAGYDKSIVLKNVSFVSEEGNLTGVLGANGCGKTTLLKAICGIIAHSGSCTLEGVQLEDLSPKKLARICSYIPQRSGIAIDISVLDVVLMGFNPQLKLLEHPTKEMKQKALQAIALVGLKGKENCNYVTLSEGQKQLCILARTLCSDTKLLLLDEPESALDFHHRYEMLSILQNWARDTMGTALLTLHDPLLALNCCNKLVILANGEVAGEVYPQNDPPKKTEALLSLIYGDVTLCRCADKNGREHIVMLKTEK